MNHNTDGQTLKNNQTPSQIDSRSQSHTSTEIYQSYDTEEKLPSSSMLQNGHLNAFSLPLHQSDTLTSSFPNNRFPCEKVKQDARDRIILKIERILNQNRLDCDDHSTLSVRDVAQALEANLFGSAPSFRHYVDASTFKSRLLLASRTFMRRRMLQTRRHTRHKQLVEVLGNDRFIAVRKLIQKIKDMKLQAMLKGSLVSCPRPENKNRGQFPLLNSHGAMAEPVRVLFFNTSLINSFESASVKTIPTIDWDSLIEQAESNLNAFKQWELECTSC